MQPNRPRIADIFNERVDCEDLAIRLGLERPGNRGNFKSPHHADKMPSVSVWRDEATGRSRFKDHSGNVSGGPVDMVMWHSGKDFTGALAELRAMYPHMAPAPDEKAAPQRRELNKVEWIADNCLAALRDAQQRELLVNYLRGRGISQAAIDAAIGHRTLGLNTYTSPKFKAGEINHGGPAAATIVRSPTTGEVIAVDMRYLDPALNGGVKTQSQGDKAGHPWCSDWRRFHQAKRVYVVESAINALSIETAMPWASAVAVRGTGSVKSMDWRIFLGKQVVLAFDNDKPQESGPMKDYCPGMAAAWAAHEALVSLDVPALMVDFADWQDDAGELINDLNDYLQMHGPDKLQAALKKLEPWLIPGMTGDVDQLIGKPRVWLPFHDSQAYWRYRVREDFTSYVAKFEKDEDSGKDKLQLENVCGFRVAAISRVTIASPTSTMTGDKDTSPTTIFAVSVQVPRYSDRLLRKVINDEQLHNVEAWKKLGPVFSAPTFLRMVNIMERAADIGAREAVNFVGLAWRNGRPVVNEGPDCYFADPRQQCPYSNLVFPSGPRANARQVLLAYQATFKRNAAAMTLVWALGAHLKAFLGFWPHFVMQAEKGSGKSTLVKRIERTIGMTMFSGQSLQTEFRILTSISATSQPVGWEEISARKQELINKAVTTLQESYQYAHTRRGADLIDFLLCAPVLLAGEDVPVRSLTGKLVRNELTKEGRGDKLAEDLPVFPVRQWLTYLADLPKQRVLEVMEQCTERLTANCVAGREDAGAERMLANYSAVLTAWHLVCDFAELDLSTGGFIGDLTAEMNSHIKESVNERQPWVWIVEKLLSEISRGTFRYPFVFDETEEDEPFLAVRTSHVMDHISSENSLREFWDALPVKSDRVFKGQLKAAGVLALEDVERTCHGKRVAHMVALSLPALEQYGLYATRPVSSEPA